MIVFDEDEKRFVESIPYGVLLSSRAFSNRVVWSKTGYNGDVDAGTEDLWSVGGTFAFPPSAMQMEVISSSADDASAGTGVQRVIVTYLDSSYVERSEVLALNGTTAVPTVATDILRVNNFRVYSVGSGGVAAGNIDIRETDDSPVYSRIATGLTRARNAAYTVPSGKTLYIMRARFGSTGTATAKNCVFTARCSYDDKRDAFLTFMMPFIEVGVEDGSIDLDFTFCPIRLPEKTDIRVVATSGAADAICTSAMRGYLETND